MSDIDALLAKLRNGREGWSGDAFCIEAETGEEAATLITSLREALEWYEVQVRDCRKITSEGDKARHALDRDGGERAREALREQS